ncbi:integral membrane protein [Dellaglioa algida DSM 15638]|uniref:Integral membrane protein n=2 Tax=Dellaglioa algida TaxID=105612 RepID=A0A0R1HI06_9LACO|nr:integral membrane protein [Dellaglioa algida DSM 15638]
MNKGDKTMLQKITLAEKINILRAGVMGANDGIISISGIVLGVAGAAVNNFGIFIAGIAGMFAGMFAMAAGEYVSVNTQKDTEKAATDVQAKNIKTHFNDERNDLVAYYQKQGISEDVAVDIADELMKKDAVLVTVKEKYGIDPDHYTNPWHAAVASMLLFPVGAALPLLAITLFPKQIRISMTIMAVIFSLILTGYVSATLGNSSRKLAIMRNVISGLLTMAMTYFIGHLFA